MLLLDVVVQTIVSIGQQQHCCDADADDDDRRRAEYYYTLFLLYTAPAAKDMRFGLILSFLPADAHRDMLGAFCMRHDLVRGVYLAVWIVC